MKKRMGFAVAALFVAMTLFPSANSSAGVWTRVDQKTLQFYGGEAGIEIGDADKLQGMLTPETTKLIVNTQGGPTSEGIKLGKIIADRRLTVEVVNKCMSSCANYMFTSAPVRIINKGIVGFHGNVKACFSTPEQQAAMVDDMRKQGVTQKAIDELLEETAHEIVDEAALLQRAGVSQALFDISCTDDKGAGDGKTYDYWLPTRRTLEQYGFHDVVGDQDAAVAAAYPRPTIIR